MQIAGIQKTTLVDYPGKVAATIFTRGCSFRCGFCHNPELVLPEQFNPLIKEEEIFNFLNTRIGKLEAVCITGGEPTIQPDINEFIRKVKKMGFLVKLDTNGSRPERLKEAIDSGNVDYIAMDIKSSPSKYELTAGVKVIMENVRKSIDIIMNSKIDYEFRTTVCHPLHEVKDFKEIGSLIQGAKRYYIQNFVESKQIDDKTRYEPFEDEELEEVKEIISKYVKEVNIR